MATKARKNGPTGYKSRGKKEKVIARPRKTERIISFKIGDKIYTECIDDNIQLSELTPDALKNAINKAVGNYAFYGALRADAKRLQSKIASEYEAWQSLVLNKLSSRPENKKKTGTAIKVLMVVEYNDQYRIWERKMREINMICDKLFVLISAFEMMSKTLQSVMAMTRTELENANSGYTHGPGNLIDE